MARTQQEIFEEVMEAEDHFINYQVPNIEHGLISQDGQDIACLYIEVLNVYGEVEQVALSVDLVEDFCLELLEYSKGLMEARVLRGIEDA